MYLQIEFSAGTSITQAGEKALALGKKLDLHVQFKFNGVSYTIYSNRGNIDGFEEKYLAAMKSSSEHKWAHN